VAGELDLERILRRLKPEKRTAFKFRADSELSWAVDERRAGAPLLLDTCVYVHVLKGKTPLGVDELLETRTLFHASTAVAELTNRLGSRIPANAQELAARKELIETIKDIPSHRLVSPTPEMWAEAGVLAGVRARLAGTSVEQDGLNDALIYLQALSVGAAVLTANIRDFDALQQLIPSGRVLFYREV